MCAWRGCDLPAAESTHLRPGIVKFSCSGHAAGYLAALNRFIPGIDRHPDNHDPDWRPSIMDCCRFGIMKLNEDRQRAALAGPLKRETAQAAGRARMIELFRLYPQRP